MSFISNKHSYDVEIDILFTRLQYAVDTNDKRRIKALLKEAKELHKKIEGDFKGSFGVDIQKLYDFYEAEEDDE